MSLQIYDNQLYISQGADSDGDGEWINTSYGDSLRISVDLNVIGATSGGGAFLSAEGLYGTNFDDFSNEILIGTSNAPQGAIPFIELKGITQPESYTASHHSWCNAIYKDLPKWVRFRHFVVSAGTVSPSSTILVAAVLWKA